MQVEASGSVGDPLSGTLVSVAQSPVATVTASSTDASVIAAVAGQRIRVLSILVGGGASNTTLVFNSKPTGSGTVISPTFTVPANGNLTPPPNNHGHFQTGVSEGLSVTTGSGSTLTILVNYITLSE